MLFLIKCFALLNKGHSISTKYDLNYHKYYTSYVLQCAHFFLNNKMYRQFFLMLSKFVVSLSMASSLPKCILQLLLCSIDYRVKIKSILGGSEAFKNLFFSSIFHRSKYLDSLCLFLHEIKYSGIKLLIQYITFVCIGGIHLDLLSAIILGLYKLCF